MPATSSASSTRRWSSPGNPYTRRTPAARRLRASACATVLSSVALPSMLSHTTPDMTRRVLDGFTVLELGQIYNVPYCALLLAHLGANVYKIEPPIGEPARQRAGGQDATPFVMLNSGKRGLRIDLKAP